MTTLTTTRAVADMCTSGDEVCDIASACTVCEDGAICSDHNDDFTTCVADADALHHGDCRLDCTECEAAYAQDHAEGNL
jgi:hypothetical protein